MNKQNSKTKQKNNTQHEEQRLGKLGHEQNLPHESTKVIFPPYLWMLLRFIILASGWSIPRLSIAGTVLVILDNASRIQFVMDLYHKYIK